MIRVADLDFQLWWAKKGFYILKQEAETLLKPSQENAITLKYIVLIIAPPPSNWTNIYGENSNKITDKMG